MHAFRSTSLRYLCVLFCLLASLASWQASAADQAQLDHAHGIDHSLHQHSEHGGGQDQQGHDHQGDHHCPNCGIHFMAIAPAAMHISAIRFSGLLSLRPRAPGLSADCPPTPPPNV